MAYGWAWFNVTFPYAIPLSGFGVYAYVGGNPLSYVDPMGLEVSLCSQPAFGGMPVDHHWIKTDTVEAGMGGMRGNVPGNQSGDMPGDPVQVTDHRGRSKEAGASCQKVDGVDENKVNAQLQIGRPLGRWGPTNQWAASNLKCNTSPCVRCCDGRTTNNVQATQA